jgi:SpoVK/Ycf46/Vps4 family AAA+-type ATPase
MNLLKEMTKPGFLPFLMQYPNSILIIEDAENIILDRKDSINPNQAVSNLLNLSDGLLGDAMHQQIITTFNCEIKGIDPALIREGRLVVEHKFDKLSTENAQRLAKEVVIDGADQIQRPMTLAEIYAKKTSSQ